MTEKLYKVLMSGSSCHGSNMKWSLPKTRKDGSQSPGKWHSVKLPLIQCENGFHLTKNPKNWWIQGADCYEVEVKGEALDYDSANDKICVQSVRLVRKLDSSETMSLFGFADVKGGVHEFISGIVYATGSATVKASGSATVKALDSATVTAFDSATVEAYNSATVTAFGSATVEAYNSATVTAYGSATVTAFGSATVEAYNSATVTAYGSATVTAYNSATVTAWDSVAVLVRGGTPKITLNEKAVLVDYRDSKLESKGEYTFKRVN